MRTHSLAVLVVFLFAAPVFALDIIELKNGRIYQVESAKVKGDRLFMQLHPSMPDQKIGFAIPISKVVPEFVYYVWADQVEGDADGHVALAKWSRKNGLFSLARKQYELAGKLDPAVYTDLPKLDKIMYEEQATWIYEDAEKMFRDGDVKRSRVRIEMILKKFAKSKETGRAKALLSILAERAQFLTEQKLQEEIAARARKQKRRIDRYLDLVAKADKLVLKTRLGYHYNATGRLHWAAYAYRKAYFVFDELLLISEVDSLRHMLKGLISNMQNRMARTFIKLADLRWISGDTRGALDAVHEVLAIEPDSKAAIGLRDRILDGGGGRGAVAAAPVVAPVRYGLGFVYARPRPYLYSTPYARGFGLASIRVHSGWYGSHRHAIRISYYPRHFYR